LEVDLNRVRFDQHGLGRLGVSADAGLVVPLVFHDHSYGVVIALDRLHEGPRFTAEDQRLLEAFATSAATAVATARASASQLHHERVAAAEDERGGWARELHDETLQSLARLRFSLSAARRRGDVQVLERAVSEAIEQLAEGVANIRALVTDLRPAALDDFGLGAAIEALADRASRHGLEVGRSIDLAYEHGLETTRHAPDLETGMYRIVQEALQRRTPAAAAGTPHRLRPTGTS
jgi:signal transduction histidine kinase